MNDKQEGEKQETEIENKNDYNKNQMDRLKKRQKRDNEAEERIREEMEDIIETLSERKKGGEEIHKEEESNSAGAETETQQTDKEKLLIETLINNYEGIDNESPETETDSQVDSNEMSGSEEEEIQYAGNNINRDDLPQI